MMNRLGPLVFFVIMLEVDASSLRTNSTSFLLKNGTIIIESSEKDFYPEVSCYELTSNLTFRDCYVTDMVMQNIQESPAKNETSCYQHDCIIVLKKCEFLTPNFCHSS